MTENEEGQEMTAEEMVNSKIELEKFTNSLLRQENKRLTSMQVKVDEEVFKLLYEKVLLEVQTHLNKVEMMQNALLALYANKVEPKRFPLNEPEQNEAVEIIKAGYDAFIEGLKEDFSKADEATKRVMKDD
jgi:hypothetical protein